MSLFRKKSLTKLRQAAFDSDTQFLMLRHRKERPQVVDVDQCRLPRKKTQLKKLGVGFTIRRSKQQECKGLKKKKKIFQRNFDPTKSE